MEDKAREVEGKAASPDKTSAETVPKTATNAETAAALLSTTSIQETPGVAVKHEKPAKIEISDQGDRLEDAARAEGGGDNANDVSSGTRGGQEDGGSGGGGGASGRQANARRRGSFKEL